MSLNNLGNNQDNIDLIFHRQKWHQQIPLTLKIAAMSIIVGVTLWIIVDSIQSRRIKDIFISQLTERLSRQAMEDRLRFDRFVKSHHQSVLFFIDHKNFTNYVESDKWKATRIRPLRYHNVIPPWMPDRRAFRTFTQPRFALLMNSARKVRELYIHGNKNIPDKLLNPNHLIIDKSQGQSYLTMIDYKPFVITSATYRDNKGALIAILMLASPIDDVFLSASTGSSAQRDIVALLSPGENPIVITSSNVLAIPPGSRLDELQKTYITTGKEFFDYGASDLVVKFASFISVDKVSRLTNSLIAQERKERALVAIVFILAFSIIAFWIAHRIERFSDHVAEFSHKTLGMTHEYSGGDQIYQLEEQFQHLTLEVIRSREIIKKQAEEQTRLIVNNAFDSIIAMDSKGIITTWNPQAEKTFGWKEHEAMGKELVNMIIPEKHREAFKTGLNRFLTSGKSELLGKSFETTGLHSDGHEFPVELSVTHTSRGNEHIFIAIIRDISERRKAEHEARQIQARLIHTNKMTALGTLVSGVVHEINNPNTFIMSNARLFQDIWQDIFQVLRNHYNKYGDFNVGSLSFTELESYVPRLLGSISKGSERIANIVTRLKHFARPDATSLDEVFNINDPVRTAVMFLEHSIKQYANNFEIEYADNIPNVKGSSQQIEQVVINLIMNALHALVKQDSRVSVSTYYESAINCAVIKVCDEGEGISAEIIDRITEPFFSTKIHRGGTGLGLSISYAIIQDHGGDIEFHSSPGNGTSVYVKLPVL